MFGRKSDEYKAVIRLYKDGKITAEQRDSLLAALVESEEAEYDKDAAAAESHESERRATSGSAGEEKRSGRRVVFKVYGMEDPLDASMLCRAVAELDGVENASTDVKGARMTVRGDFDSDAVKATVKKLGFHCAASDVDYYDEKDDELDKDLDELEKEFDELEEEFDEDDDEDDDDDDDEDDEDDDDDDNTRINIHVDGDDPTIEISKDGKKSVKYFFSDLGEKIASAVNKGVRAAESAGQSVAKAFEGIEPNLRNIVSGGALVSKKSAEASAPYEELKIKVKYIGDGVYGFEEKTTDAEKLKAQCREVMSDGCYELLCSLLEERFVGKYSKVGAEIFKLTVE